MTLLFCKDNAELFQVAGALKSLGFNCTMRASKNKPYLFLRNNQKDMGDVIYDEETFDPYYYFENPVIERKAVEKDSIKVYDDKFTRD